MQKKSLKWMMLVLAAALLCLIPAGRTKAEPKAYEMLVPDAATHLYTQAELADMSAQIACYARNEIYASHGRKFRSAELNAWFSEQPWYVGSIEPDDFSDNMLNNTESKNVDALLAREMEASGGSRYTLNQPGYDFSPVYRYLYGSFDIFAGLEVYATSGIVIMDADHFYMMIPNNLNWGYQQTSKDSFEIYHKPSRQAGFGGGVVSITAYDPDDTDYEMLPSYKVCGITMDKVYVAAFPTDVQFDPQNEESAAEYRKLLDWAYTLDDESMDVDNPFEVREMEDGGDPDIELQDRAE